MNNPKDVLFNLNMFKPKISKQNVYNNRGNTAITGKMNKNNS